MPDWRLDSTRFPNNRIVVLITTGSYHQPNCSSLPISEPCPPDRSEQVAMATDPTHGWLRGTRYIVISNHPWAALRVRGVHEVALGRDVELQNRKRLNPKNGTRRHLRTGGGIAMPFVNHVMIAGVLLINDTYGGTFDWLVSGDDDTVFLFSQLSPSLAAFDPRLPLFLGVPGPVRYGRFYCAEQGTAERHRRGPVCCADPSRPCPVAGVGIALPRLGGVSWAPMHLAFFREDEEQPRKGSLRLHEVLPADGPGRGGRDSDGNSSFSRRHLKGTGRLKRQRPYEYSDGLAPWEAAADASTPLSSLVLRPVPCAPALCCGASAPTPTPHLPRSPIGGEGGGEGGPLASSPPSAPPRHGQPPLPSAPHGPEEVDRHLGRHATAASQLHWPAGHYVYGGSGWALSRGLLAAAAAPRNGGGRALWERCAAAAADCGTQAPDVALARCIFNLGYAASAAPHGLFASVAAERQFVRHRKGAAGLQGRSGSEPPLPGTRPYLAAQAPGTFPEATLHKRSPREAGIALALEDATMGNDAAPLLRHFFPALAGSNGTQKEAGGGGTATAASLFWRAIAEKCGCAEDIIAHHFGQGPMGDPAALARAGTGCVPSNCGREQNQDRRKGPGACCRCTEEQWRGFYSPHCSWL